MEKWDFDLAMRRLVSVYGEKSFPPDRVSILWNRFHGLDPFKWKEMIDSLIATQRFVPLLNEMETWLLENKNFYKSPERVAGCKTCDGHGTFMEDVNGYMYGYRCECHAGNPFSSLPSRRRSSYEVILNDKI